MMNHFVPNVIVIGDVEIFKAAIENKPAKIIADFPEPIADDLKKFDFDYIVFTDPIQFINHCVTLNSKDIPIDQIMMTETYIRQISNGFQSYNNESALYKFLSEMKIQTILDLDDFFNHSVFYSKPYDLKNLIIDSGKNFNRLHHYDVVLMTAIRNNKELSMQIYETLNLSDNFLFFLHDSAEGINLNADLADEFDGGSFCDCIRGKFYFIKKKEKTDICIYVVTHKKFDIEKILPQNYQIIHAGRALKDDLNYLGDDSGENISKLNPYLNELTAAYWIWKNTSHDFVGLVHYRRFFSADEDEKFSEEKIISAESARQLLNNFDLIVANEHYYICNTKTFLINDVGFDVANLAIVLTRESLALHQPNYLETFDYIVDTCSLFKCNMFITRKYVFDSYCQWLFSFIFEAVEKFNKIIPFEKLHERQKRIFGFICERMLSVWIRKNKLDVKEMTVMEVK